MIFNNILNYFTLSGGNISQSNTDDYMRYAHNLKDILSIFAENNSFNMIKIKDPEDLTYIRYDHLYDDFKDADASSFLMDVPTDMALSFIIMRQNEVMLTPEDPSIDFKYLDEMRSYMSSDVQDRIDSFIRENDSHLFIDNYSCLLFYLFVLKNHNTINKPKLEHEDFVNIYRAYLYCAQDKFNRMQLPIIKDYSPLEKTICLALPIAEFDAEKNIIYEIYKSARFLAFCKRDPCCSEFLKWFLDERNVPNIRAYLEAFNSLYYSMKTSGKHLGVRIPNEYSYFIPYFDQFSIDITQCIDVNKRLNINYLRNHFLYKRSDDTYFLLSENFLIDKMYQGLILDFGHIVIKRQGKNDTGTVLKNIPMFKSFLAEKFSEPELFYDALADAFPPEAIKYSGNELTQKGIHGAPDYYVRNRNIIYIFEYKDGLLGDDVKWERDPSIMMAGVFEKICRYAPSPKGGVQLLHCINKILNRNMLAGLDDFNPEGIIFYPVLVVNDVSFNAKGMTNVFANGFYKIKTHEFNNLKANIRFPMIIHIDTILAFKLNTRERSFMLNEAIESYHQLYSNPDEPMISFETFLRETTKVLDYTKDNHKYYMSKIINDLGD